VGGMSEDGRKPLSEYSEEELMAELARRAAQRLPEQDGYEAELQLEQQGRQFNYERYEAYLRRLQQRERKRRSAPCPRCGKPVGVRRKAVRRTVQSLWGEHHIERNYHYCSRCRHGFYPLDEQLQLAERGEESRLLGERMLEMAVKDGSYQEAASSFRLHYGRAVSERWMRKVVQRAGQAAEQMGPEQLRAQLAPCRKQPEPSRLLVVELDGSMVPVRDDPKERFKEVKVAVLYRAEQLLAGAAGRQRGCIERASYVARLDFPAFRQELDATLKQQRCEQAEQLAVLGDGASWIWKWAEQRLPQAEQVLDYYHAREHLRQTAERLFGTAAHPCKRLFLEQGERLLLQGQVNELLEQLREAQQHASVGEAAALGELIGYYERNAQRMDYRRYRQRGIPIGSGTVESAHRHVVKRRLRQAGQRWSCRKADQMAQLRALRSTAGPERFARCLRAAPARAQLPLAA